MKRKQEITWYQYWPKDKKIQEGWELANKLDTCHHGYHAVLIKRNSTGVVSNGDPTVVNISLTKKSALSAQIAVARSAELWQSHLIGNEADSKEITMQFYNPNKPEWSEPVDCFYEFDAQIDRTNAMVFNAASFDDAIEKAKKYGAKELTQFARPLRIVRTEAL